MKNKYLVLKKLSIVSRSESKQADSFVQKSFLTRRQVIIFLLASPKLISPGEQSGINDCKRITNNKPFTPVLVAPQEEAGMVSIFGSAVVAILTIGAVVWAI